LVVQGRKNTEGQRSVDWDFTEGETSVDLSTGTSQRGRPLSTCRLGFHRGGTSVNLSTGTSQRGRPLSTCRLGLCIFQVCWGNPLCIWLRLLMEDWFNFARSRSGPTDRKAESLEKSFESHWAWFNVCNGPTVTQL
jgi:hypothetical protein